VKPKNKTVVAVGKATKEIKLAFRYDENWLRSQSIQEESRIMGSESDRQREDRNAAFIADHSGR